MFKNLRCVPGLLALVFAVFATPVRAQGSSSEKLELCHRPPDNPAKYFTMKVPANAVPSHLGHGDLLGACSANCDLLCSDGKPCTVDSGKWNESTERCECSNTPVAPRNDDGCCPPGGNAGNDNDCATSCGDGVVSPGETCDPGLPGSCPTACDDGDACTRDVLLNAGTCFARCTFTGIGPGPSDGCCPDGANSNNDADCKPVCGNGVVEVGEECDPPSATCDESCQLIPQLGAFRITQMFLRDPHVFAFLGGCIDLTDGDVGSLSVNGQLNAQLQSDKDGDGNYDMTPVLVFRPLAQDKPMTSVDLVFARCTAGSNSTCTGTGRPMYQFAASNHKTGTCLGVLNGTLTDEYSPEVSVPTNDCFATSSQNLSISLQGSTITLYDATFGAVYENDPATGLKTGLMRGFITEEDAEATIVPLPVLGDTPLAKLLPGSRDNCASGKSDKDTGPDGKSGWYFYLNFSGTKTSYRD